MFPVTLTSFLLVFILGIPRFKELFPDGPEVFGFGFAVVLFLLKSPVTSFRVMYSLNISPVFHISH